MHTPELPKKIQQGRFMFSQYYRSEINLRASTRITEKAGSDDCRYEFANLARVIFEYHMLVPAKYSVGVDRIKDYLSRC